MNSNDLLSCLDPTELTYEATPLSAWEMGVVHDMESVARYMYKGGPFPPQASAKPPRRIVLSEDDPRPEKRYWELVKEELTAFLCTNDKKYKELWSRISALEKKGTTGVVAVLSAYLGEQFGVTGAMLAGFVAVFLYGVIKVGKEAYCRHAGESAT